MSAFGLALKLAELLAALAGLWKSHRERRAGRAEAILEHRERTDAALAKADDARARRRGRDAAGGLREDDGFRRD